MSDPSQAPEVRNLKASASSRKESEKGLPAGGSVPGNVMATMRLTRSSGATFEMTTLRISKSSSIHGNEVRLSLRFLRWNLVLAAMFPLGF